MKGIRFANVIAVWKWWYKSVYMFVFSQNFLLSVHHVNVSIYIWNCCNQAQFLNKKWSWSVLRLKFLHDIFYNSQLKNYNCNSTHSYNRKILLVIPSYIIFPWCYCYKNFKNDQVGKWNQYLSRMETNLNI